MKLNPNQQVTIQYLDHGRIQVTSKQNHSTPGAYMQIHVQPNTKYMINFRGYHIGDSSIRLWIADKNKKTLYKWDGKIKKKLSGATFDFLNKKEKKINVGILFINPKRGNCCIIKHMGVDLAKSSTINKSIQTLKNTKTIPESISNTKSVNISNHSSGKKIAIVVYTYDRYMMLKHLLDSIQVNLSTNYEYRVFIFDDASPKKQTYIKTDYSFEIYYHRFSVNHGKVNWYIMIDYIFKFFKSKKFHYYIFTSDDMQFIHQGIEKSVQLYEGIKDDNKGCLNIHNDRGPFSRWVKHQPKNYDKQLWRTYWIDMCFLCKYQTLKKLNFGINFTDFKKIIRHNKYGSGVGKFLSIKLDKQNVHIYLVKNSLIYHLGNDESKMNPKERKINQLVTRL